MKVQLRLVAFFSILLFASLESFSQIGIQLSSDRKIYLQYEPIFIKVQMRNYSGKTLVFGETDDMQGSISFHVENPKKNIAEQRKKTYNPLLGVILPSGGAEQVIVPIHRLYHMSDLGVYNVRATIKHRSLPSSYESNQVSFNVVSGKVVWEKTVGVPDFYSKEGEPRLPERSVKILSFYDGNGNIYALQIEDSDKIYGVARIGKDIGGKGPECEIDGLSRLHILVPVSPALFAYFCYDINCEVDDREAFLKTSSTPTLVLDPKEGTVIVAGGKKAVKDLDFIENEDGMPTFKQ